MPNEFDYLVDAFGDDPSGLPRLESIALDSLETFSVEGAFVDRTEAESDAALLAISRTYTRHGVREADLARMRALLHDGTPHANPVPAVLAKVGPELIPDLLAALAHADPVVRIRALQTLGLLGRGSAAVAMISDPDPAVRSAAARLQPGGEAWVRELALRLGVEPSVRERIELVEALGRVRATNAILALLGRAADPDGDVRARAAHLLSGLKSGQGSWDLPRIAAAALQWIQVEPEPAIVANLLRYVPVLPHAPQAVAALVALLADAERVLPQVAARGLGRAGDDTAAHAAAALRQLTASKDERTEIEAFKALAELRDQGAIAGFAARLPVWRVQPGERGHLEDLLKNLRLAARPLPEPATALAATRPRVLDRAQLPPPELSEKERTMLADLADPARQGRALEQAPRPDRQRWWLSVLAQRLPREPEASGRAAIVEAALKSGLPEAVDVGLAALDDPDAMVRELAARRLRFKGDERVARAVLRRLGVETEPSVQRSLLDHEYLLGCAPEAAPVIHALAQDQDPRLRALAVAQFRALKFPGEVSALPFLDDPDPGVRAAAIHTLEAIGSSHALPRLRALLADPAEKRNHPAARKAIEWIEWREVHQRPSHWN